MKTEERRGPLLAAGILLGIGMGGFVDGIVLHQILQWHHMLSAIRPPTDLIAIKVNMVWDGLFHAFTWLATMIGLALLWRAGSMRDVPWITRIFVGSLLMGWGIFNLVEGLINHQLLGIHHVHPSAALGWDLAFLASGVALIAVGWLLVRRREQHPAGARVSVRPTAEATARGV